MILFVCTLVASLCLWQRRNIHQLARIDTSGSGGCGLSEQLTANPLQSSALAELRRSSSASTKAAAVAQRSTDVYTLLRIVYQPVRIIVGYVQVVTQIGPVLDLQLPEGILKLVKMLNFIDLQQIFALDCLSGGWFDFYSKWLTWVFVVPATLLAVVGLRYCYERRRKGAAMAAGQAMTDSFVVIFLLYPGLCNHAFSMVNCRALGPGVRVLVEDFSISCLSSRHPTYTLVAWVYIALVAFGVPLQMAWQMVRRMQEYKNGSSSGGGRFVARRVADELKVDDVMAADAIRDVATGREYSFLVNAYKPRYYYWEGYDMVRKLMLVGMLVIFSRGSVTQLFMAIIISFGSFALQVKLAPYRHAEDNLLKAMIEAHIFLIVSIALALKGLEADNEYAGYKNYYDGALIAGFVVAVPVSFFGAILAKRRVIGNALREAAAASTDDQSTEARKRAVRLLQLGLTSNDDMRLLSEYFRRLDAMVNKMTCGSHSADEMVSMFGAVVDVWCCCCCCCCCIHL